jgi:hypothetical protein
MNNMSNMSPDGLDRGPFLALLERALENIGLRRRSHEVKSYKSGQATSAQAEQRHATEETVNQKPDR